MQSLRQRCTQVLMVFSLLMLVLPTLGTVPQAAAQPESPIVTNAEWVVVDEDLTFAHASLPYTSFQYREHDLAHLAVPDNLFLMEVATIFPFIDEMGIERLPELGASDPAADPLWYLRFMEYQGVTRVVLFTVSVTAVPGKGAVEILITTPGNLATALTSAQQGITAYGAPIMLARIDSDAVLAAGGQGLEPGDSATLQTPAAPPPGGATGAGEQVNPSCDPATGICNTYEFGGGWVVDPGYVSSGIGGGFGVKHSALANTSFNYNETPCLGTCVPDNEGFLQSFAISILSQIGQTSPFPLAIGTLTDGTLWHLYAVPVEGTTYGMLLTADTADPSQNIVHMMLTSPASSFDQALAAAQTDIRVNGVSPLAGIDPAQLMTALGVGAAVTPPSGTTPAAPPSIPLDQSATVGTDTVAYGGDWQYDPANSAATIATFENALDPRLMFVHLQAPDRMSGGDAQLALELFDAPASFAAQNVQQVAGETLPSGHAYVLYAWEREGAAEVALFVVDVTTTPGTASMQALFAPPDQFASGFTSVQQSFQVNGVAPFSELDPAALAALLGGGPAAATTPTVTTSVGGQSITVAGVTITYTSAWVYDTVNSKPDGVTYFDAADGSATWFGYLPGQSTTGDAAADLADFTTRYFEDIGATEVQQLTLQALSPSSAWALTTANVSEFPIAVLTYADTASAGELRIQMLYITDTTDTAAKLTDVQGNIQINGVPAFAGVDPTAVAALLGGGTIPTTGTTPPAVPTPTSSPDRPTRPPGGVTTPTATTSLGGQSITVAGVTITYTAAWVYDTVNSKPDGVTYFDAADGSATWFGYLPGQSTTGDAAAQLADFTTRYFGDIGATEVQQLTFEAISPTSAWALTTAKVLEFPIAVLTYADTATAGELRIQMLYITNTTDAASKLTDVQGNIQINGAPAFAGVDPTAVAALLGGGTIPATGEDDTGAALFTSERYGYTLTYDPAVWQITPDDDDSDAEEWVTLVSDASTVNIVGRPDTTRGDLTRCVNAYLVDYGWDDGAWKAVPIESLVVEPGRAAGSFALTDQIFGEGTAYMFVECRDISNGNTLLISQFVFTEEGETVPITAVAEFEKLVAGLQFGSRTDSASWREELLVGITVSGR